MVRAAGVEICWAITARIVAANGSGSGTSVHGPISPTSRANAGSASAKWRAAFVIVAFHARGDAHESRSHASRFAFAAVSLGNGGR